MGFVAIHKAARKPKWQDVRPKERELREAHRVAFSQQAAFSRAFMQVSRTLIDDQTMRAIRSKLNDSNSTVEDVVNAVPWYIPGDPESEKVWAKFQEQLERAYEKVVVQAGQDGLDRFGIPMRFEVTKADVPVVPPNPHSLRWIKRHSAEMLADVSERTKQTVRRVVREGYEQGQHARAIADRIQDAIGLTEREEQAAARRLKEQLDAGMPRRAAEANTNDYRRELLRQRSERIARTETIAAQNQGLQDSWRVAQEQGIMPQGTIRRWVAMSESERTCEICEELDGAPADINGTFDSSIVGTLERPPAHPSCRCTVILEFP